MCVYGHRIFLPVMAPLPNIALDVVDFTEIVSDSDNVMPSIVFQPLNVYNIQYHKIRQISVEFES